MQPTLPPRFHDGLPERLAADGFAPDVVAALLAFDGAMFLWHRMAMKGEVQGRLLAELGLDLELSQFHGLTAITRIQNGIGRPAPLPATIGLLAEEMSIDPSRASRIASDLITRGYLRREVAQDDGRKSVLVLTEQAVTAFCGFRDLKWDKLLAVFSGWSAEDITRFSALFTRYGCDLRRVFAASGEGRV